MRLKKNKKTPTKKNIYLQHVHKLTLKNVRRSLVLVQVFQVKAILILLCLSGYSSMSHLLVLGYRLENCKMKRKRCGQNYYGTDLKNLLGSILIFDILYVNSLLQYYIYRKLILKNEKLFVTFPIFPSVFYQLLFKGEILIVVFLKLMSFFW